jgi:uncharacterized membrane protein YbhN (UPF0104 family)
VEVPPPSPPSAQWKQPLLAFLAVVLLGIVYYAVVSGRWRVILRPFDRFGERNQKASNLVNLLLFNCS